MLVLGNGWLGNLIAKYFDCPIYAGVINDDMRSQRLIMEYLPKVVINAIGKSGETRVNWCDNHKNETYFSNVHVPYLLAQSCKKYGIKLVHLSTCYIDYDKSFYTLTKAMAEEILKEYDDVLITRINLPLDKTSHPRNLIDKLLTYEKVTGAKSSITVIDDYLFTLKQLIEKDEKGIFNCVNPGVISPWEIIDLYEKVSCKNLNKIFVEDNKKFEIIPDVDMPEVSSSVLKQLQLYLKKII